MSEYFESIAYAVSSTIEQFLSYGQMFTAEGFHFQDDKNTLQLQDSSALRLGVRHLLLQILEKYSSLLYFP